MPKLAGAFSNFLELDKLSAQQLHTWLKAKEQGYYLENFIGNRILYPQTIAVNSNDLEIDLAILREYIKVSPTLVYSPKLKKLVIPEELEVRFPPLPKLIVALLDVLTLELVTPILLKKANGSTELIGSVIRPMAKKDQNFTDVNVNGQLLKLEYDSTTILPNGDQNIVVQIDSDVAFNVTGGRLGIVIDLKKNV